MQSNVAEELENDCGTEERKEPIVAPASCTHETVLPNEYDQTLEENAELQHSGEESEDTQKCYKAKPVASLSKPIPIPASPRTGPAGGMTSSSCGSGTTSQAIASLPSQNILGNPNLNRMATQTAFSAMMSVWEPVRAFVSRLQNLTAAPAKFSFPKFSIPSWMWGGGSGNGNSKNKETKGKLDLEIDMGDEDDDMFCFGNMPVSQQPSSQDGPKDLFMGKYSEKDLWKIINEWTPHYFGKTIRQLLESRGYKDIDLEIDTSDPFVHKLNLYYVGNLKRKEDDSKNNTAENSTISLVTSDQQQQQHSQNATTENGGSIWSFFNGNDQRNRDRSNSSNSSSNSNSNSNSNGSSNGSTENSGGAGIWPFSLLGPRTPDKKKATEKKEADEKEKEHKDDDEKIEQCNNESEKADSEESRCIRSPSPSILGISSPPITHDDLLHTAPSQQTASHEEPTPTKKSPATEDLFGTVSEGGNSETKSSDGKTQSLLTKELEGDCANVDDDDEDDDSNEETDGRRFSPSKLLAQLFVRRETSFSVMETKSFTCKESGVPKFYAKAFNDGLFILRDFFKAEKLQMVVIEWLRMQDPLKPFGKRTPLPGQLHPGLGLGVEAAKALCSLARKNGRDGILNLPEHFYNAYLYAQGFNLYRFLNPAFEGYFKSICKAIEPDIKERGISAVAWAVFRGMLHCRMSDDDDAAGAGTGKAMPARIKWVSQEQVCPLSGRMTKYFKSSAYENAVKKAYHPEAFFIMWDQLEDDSYISTSCPN